MRRWPPGCLWMARSGILQAGTRALGYDIVTLIGSGQFGEVYEVIDSTVGRRSALKLIEVSDPSTHKAVIEARAQYLCAHNNVVQIYTADEIAAGSKNYVTIEMEFIPGGSLEDRLQSGFISCKESVYHIKQILFALEHAHGYSFVHRDVKPGNIMLAEPRTKLSDFGTIIHPLTGTAVINQFYRPHAPPEALNSNDFSQLSDVHAAGMTLLRCVNNIQDWRAYLASLNDWNALARKGLLAKKIGYQSYVPRGLRTILNKACHPVPSQRYESAAALRGALENLRFSNEWIKLSDDEWQSSKRNRVERITLEYKTSFDVIYTINGRKKNDLCKKFSTEHTARQYMEKIIYNTTLD